MQLTIDGSESSGFHLVKAPEGFFTADSWHATKTEALAVAARLFGVAADAWREGC